jgi:hypothetical protein
VGSPGETCIGGDEALGLEDAGGLDGDGLDDINGTKGVVEEKAAVAVCITGGVELVDKIVGEIIEAAADGFDTGEETIIVFGGVVLVNAGALRGVGELTTCPAPLHETKVAR